MSDDNNRENSTGRTILGCIAGVFITFTLVVILLCGGLYLAYRYETSFAKRRAQMCIRNDVAVEDAHFVYSPGFDYIMWSKFKARVDSIDEVFDARVDPTEFSEGFEINVSWIKNYWWDPGDHELSGAHFQVSGDEYMDIGYVDNGDGTFTVYIYLFEV